MTPSEIAAVLAEEIDDAGVSLEELPTASALLVPRERFADVMRLLRDDERLLFDSLQLVTAVDYPPETIECVYHLFSIERGHGVVVKVRVPRDKPEIESVASLWPAADWHEREQYDLMGVIYVGHPDLRRILCPEDWEGHPLRKDYVVPDEYHGITTSRD